MDSFSSTIFEILMSFFFIFHHSLFRLKQKCNPLLIHKLPYCNCLGSDSHKNLCWIYKGIWLYFSQILGIWIFLHFPWFFCTNTIFAHFLPDVLRICQYFYIMNNDFFGAGPKLHAGSDEELVIYVHWPFVLLTLKSSHTLFSRALYCYPFNI